MAEPQPNPNSQPSNPLPGPADRGFRFDVEEMGGRLGRVDRSPPPAARWRYSTTWRPPASSSNASLPLAAASSICASTDATSDLQIQRSKGGAGSAALRVRRTACELKGTKPKSYRMTLRETHSRLQRSPKGWSRIRRGVPASSPPPSASSPAPSPSAQNQCMPRNVSRKPSECDNTAQTITSVQPRGVDAPSAARGAGPRYSMCTSSLLAGVRSPRRLGHSISEAARANESARSRPLRSEGPSRR